MNKVLKTLHKLVIVEWDDSRQPDRNWSVIEDMNDFMPAKCTSVGFLLHQDKNILVIASNIARLSGEADQACGIIRIPKGCITKITNFK